MALEVSLSCFDIDLVPHLHELNSIIDHVLGHSSLDCNIPSVQVHVASLDAFDAEGTEGCQILG